MSELHERPPGMRLLDPWPFVLETRRRAMAAQSGGRSQRSVRANGIDIHVVEAGAGEPLLMLENGMISTSPIWAERGDWLSSYVRHIDTLAGYFRVIVPRIMRQGLRAYLRYLDRYTSPAARLCDAGVPAWVVHAEKGDGGLTREERSTLKACPRTTLVTIPGAC